MWYVYIVECSDGKLYTGITNDVGKRLKQHNMGLGCRFTKPRFPVKLLYAEDCFSKGVALSREAAIKSLTRKGKLEIISAKNST
jgi:putative endonuclease